MTYDRRSFIKIGAGGLAGLSLSGVSFGAPTRRSGMLSLSDHFLIEPGLISRFEPDTRKVIDSTLWTVPSSRRTLAPALLAPTGLGLGELESWGQGEFEEFGQSDVAELLRAPHISLDVSDLIGASVLAVESNQNLELSLTFLQGEGSAGFTQVLTSEAGIPVLDPAAWPAGSFEEAPDKRFTYVSPTVLGWKLVVAGIHDAPFGDCVRQSVKHFNVQVHRIDSRGRGTIISNFHLGTYRSGSSRCFALYNNKTPRVCWKKCSPSRSDLQQMLAWALAAAAAAAGIAIAAWVVSSIAATASAALYASLLLLV